MVVDMKAATLEAGGVFALYMAMRFSEANYDAAQDRRAPDPKLVEEPEPDGTEDDAVGWRGTNHPFVQKRFNVCAKCGLRGDNPIHDMTSPGDPPLPEPLPEPTGLKPRGGV